MSVGKRISDTIDKMEVSDPEGALFQICAAIEVTATIENSKPGQASFKDFIHRNLGLITDIAFGGPKLLNLHLGYHHPRLKAAANGCVSVQDIIYHVVRCGLYHAASLPTDLQFTDERQIAVRNGVLVLPSSLIYGLITAVIVSPANRNERSPKEGLLNIGSFAIPISKLWGRRDELLWLLDAVNELNRLRSPVT